VIAGGGTAGHVFPALATAESLVHGHGANVSFIGTAAGLEAGLVERHGFAFNPVGAIPLQRKVSIDTFRLPFAFARAVKECRPLVAKADVVLGMGGYVSGPAVSAAIKERVPVVLHEQNAIPGLANKVYARRAKVVALSFEEAGRRLARSAKKAVTGNPVRSSVATIRTHRNELRSEALEVLGLDSNRRTVVVFGGSQGAVHVNQVAVEACRVLSGRADTQVLILAGRKNGQTVAQALDALGTGEPGGLKVSSMAFLDRMELAYAVADLVIARAGATSIAEITAAGLACILIPYPHATAGHQDANAKVLEHAGAAVIVGDAGLSAIGLAGLVSELLDDDAKRESMAKASMAWGTPDAAASLAALIARTAAIT
jgi:UDP-N-acetylglucosamine--N-acetylmuramyl-(pentapeptide) pyrophosphoryl-undecaprenol N-acetylglucosamine transferase